MTKIYKTKKEAQKIAKQLKRHAPHEGAWGVVQAPNKKGWLVGTRNQWVGGWRIPGLGWLKEL